MSKPIIFLDFDGVLNTIKTWGKFPREEAIDPDKVQRGQQLAKEVGADIVISSAWRSIHTLEELRSKLNNRGGMDPALVIDVTPEPWGKMFVGPRGQEIKEWLIENKRKDDPFVILDDLGASCFTGLETHHIQTTLREGFTEERLDAARECFKRQQA